MFMSKVDYKHAVGKAKTAVVISEPRSIEMILSQLVIMVAAITYAMFGLFCSSLMKSTMAASVLTFAGILFFTMGIPGFALFGVAIASPFMYGASSSWIAEAMLAIGAVLLAATNLPATLITSAAFLIEEGGVFYINQDFYGGGTAHSVPLPSPWVLFIFLHLAVALFLYWLTVRRVRRISTK